MAKGSKKILEHFERVYELFDKIAEKNKECLENAKINPIHNLFPFSQNGICAFIAPMSSGKTYNCLKMVAQQEGLFDKPFFERIVLCSTSGEFCETTLTFGEAIAESELITIKDVDLLTYLEEYSQKMLLFNTLNKFVNNNLRNPSKNMQQIINENRLTTNEKLVQFISKKLIEIGWKSYPSRMLLICEDFASHPLLNRKEDPLSRFFKKLLHFNINVIIIVQTTRSIPRDLKRNLTDVILFPGVCEDDFRDFFRESSASCFEYRKYWSHYTKINDQQTQFRIHITPRKVLIVPPKADWKSYQFKNSMLS
jgi:hypothetical protein